MLPSVLKNFNVFVDGKPHPTEAQEIVLPKLTVKTEEFRAGGMNGAIEIDMGTEKLELETTYGGFMDGLLNTFGGSQIESTMVRFAGAYQRDDTGNVDAIEVVVRGRHTEIDSGNATGGDKTEFKVKTACNYYKLIVNGETRIEIDHKNFIYMVNGTDRLEQHRQAIGL